jgi:hypothetical protein
LVDHRPLRYHKGQDICPGNANPFSIRRKLALGHEITTDVFELQPQQPLTRAGANALVIALREALAQELGIEADEMGFAVEQTRGALGGPAVSLFLFDRASGGAGFSISLEHNMRGVLRKAERILDCKTPGCETGCAACVLTSDAPDGPDALSRLAALAFVRTHLSIPDQLPDEDQFGPDAQLSVAPLDEIDRFLRRTGGSRLTVILPAATELTSMADWPLAEQFPNWKTHGHPCQLGIPPALLKTFNVADKLALRDFALRHSVELVELSVPSLPNGAHVFACVKSSEEIPAVWVSRDASAGIPGLTWSRPKDFPVAFGSMHLALTTSPINLDSLRQPAGAQMMFIDGELDGELATFGDRMAERLIGLLNDCSGWSSSPLSTVVYQDPYVSSPLVSRLIIDTLDRLLVRLKSTSAKVTIETRGPRPDERLGDPWQLFHDWREPAAQKSCIETFGKQVGLSVSVDQKSVPHGRFMVLSFANGREATIVLDQGFGAWSIPRHVRMRHNFSADAATQVAALRQVNAVLARTGAGKTYLVGTVSDPKRS